MDDQEFRSLLDLFPVVRPRDHRVNLYLLYSLFLRTKLFCYCCYCQFYLTRTLVLLKTLISSNLHQCMRRKGLLLATWCFILPLQSLIFSLLLFWKIDQCSNLEVNSDRCFLKIVFQCTILECSLYISSKTGFFVCGRIDSLLGLWYRLSFEFFYFWFLQADLDSSRQSTSQSVVEREVTFLSLFVLSLIADDIYA